MVFGTKLIERDDVGKDSQMGIFFENKKINSEMGIFFEKEHIVCYTWKKGGTLYGRT